MKRSLKDEADDKLVYTDTNSKVDLIMYSFESSKLNGAVAILKLLATDATELGKFYRERYDYIGEKDNMLMLTDGKVAVGIKVQSSGIMIAYVEASISNDTKSLSESENEYYMKLKSKMNSFK